MAKSPEEFIKLDFPHKHANGVLRLVTFKDHDWFVSFCPSLNLSYYGKTEHESIDSFFKVVLSDYFHELFNLSESEITAELAKYNFKKTILRKKYFQTAPFIDNEGILRNFNLPAETQIKESFVTV